MGRVADVVVGGHQTCSAEKGPQALGEPPVVEVFVEAHDHRVGGTLGHHVGPGLPEFLGRPGAAQAENGLAGLDQPGRGHRRGDHPAPGVDTEPGEAGFDLGDGATRVVGHEEHLLAGLLETGYRPGGPGHGAVS